MVIEYIELEPALFTKIFYHGHQCCIRNVKQAGPREYSLCFLHVANRGTQWNRRTRVGMKTYGNISVNVK